MKREKKYAVECEYSSFFFKVVLKNFQENVIHNFKIEIIIFFI